jgi:hypothetical protein
MVAGIARVMESHLGGDSYIDRGAVGKKSNIFRIN